MVATQFCICLIFSIAVFDNFYSISGELAPTDATVNASADAFIEKCNHTHPISADAWSHMNTTGSFADENDKVSMCFVRCYLQGAGILDGSGKLQKPKAKEMWGSHSEEFIQHCFEMRDPNGEDPDPCVQTYTLVKCISTAAIEKSKSG